MADYWKSQPRHYCEACKCWFGGNKASIDFHESGKRHQQNVEKQLRGARSRATQDRKETAETNRMLASIEQAAQQAYLADLGLGSEEEPAPSTKTKKEKHKYQQKGRSKGGPSHAKPKNVTAPLPQVPSASSSSSASFSSYTASSFVIPTTSSAPSGAGLSSSPVTSADTSTPSGADQSAQFPWQQLTSPEGYTYYYNVSQWDCPPEYYQYWYGTTTATPTTGTETQSQSSMSSYQPTTVSASGEGGQKRLAEEAGVDEAYSHLELKRPARPYGAWTTVAIRERNVEEEKETEDKDGGEKVEATSSEEEEGVEEEEKEGEEKRKRHLLFSERTLPTTSDNATEESGGFKGFSFKKRETKRPQIRQRTSDFS